MPNVCIKYYTDTPLKFRDNEQDLTPGDSLKEITKLVTVFGMDNNESLPSIRKSEGDEANLEEEKEGH